jgi:polysaccharide export outer membrane protein
MLVWMLAGLCVGVLPSRVAGQSDRVRPQDVLQVTVVDQPTLTQKFPVDADGRVTLPMIGTLQAAGLSVDQLAAEMRRRLSNGFLNNPQVRIDIERAMRVFVFGGVTTPGMYPLTRSTTLMEVLARAGYQGASEVIIVRAKNGGAAPALPDQEGTEVIRVNLREFEKELEQGKLSRNVLLADADTIYVPRFDPNRVFVSGQVRNPGAFSVPDKTTVLQALALAGGPTERAALGKIKIMRLVDGKQKTINAKLEDLVRAGDTLIVPERYF